MITMNSFVCAALSLSFLFSTDTASAQSATDWGCKVGQCSFKSTPSPQTSSQETCVKNQKSFFVEGIENAVSGPQAGSFKFIGSLVGEGSGSETLDTYFPDPVKRDYLKDVVVTVHVRDSVKAVSVRLLDAEGNYLGNQPKADPNMTVFYWSRDVDPSPAVSPNIKFELQGNVAPHADVAGHLDSPKLLFVVKGTRCQSL